MEYKYHYVYRIYNIVEKKHYYGCRSSNIKPEEDLGFVYFSSSLDVDFQKDQKINKQNYKYKIIRIFNSRNDAINLEIYLHEKFKVDENPKFYNNYRQSSSRFDWVGRTHSEKTKNKISDANKGRVVSENTRIKLSKLAKGRKLSKETKIKMSKPKSEVTKNKMKCIALNRSPELQQKMTNSSTGWHHSENTKKHLSNLASNRSEETLSKMSIANKGKKFYYNPITEKTIFIKGECPDGYFPGRYNDKKKNI